MKKLYRQFSERFDKYKGNINYGILAMILILIIGGTTLFISPCIGMADNGDFYRTISQTNLYHLVKDRDDMFLGYFNKYYGINQYYTNPGKMLFTTQAIIVKIAVLVDRFLTKDYIFDIRFLALIYLLVHALGSYFIAKVFTEDLKREWHKIILTLIVVFIFGDTAYIAYFNSFYAEATSLCFFILSIGIFLNMCRFQRFTLINILSFAVSTFLFLGSKQQLSPIGALLFILLIRMGFVINNRVYKIVSLGLAVFFIAAAGYLFVGIKGDFDYMNRYHAMTRGILLYENNPEEIIKSFNIDEQYAMLQENIFFEDVPMINPYSEELKEKFFDKYSTFTILGYYLKHPDSLVKMLGYAADNGYDIKPPAMGNYEKTEGKPFKAQSNFFSLWSNLKKNIPHGLLLSCIYISSFLWIAINKYIKAFKNKDSGYILFEEGMIYVLLVGLSQIAISIIGAGDADLAKHVFMYNISFDLMVIYIINGVLVARENKLQKRQR